jgi:hypothetical protein
VNEVGSDHGSPEKIWFAGFSDVSSTSQYGNKERIAPAIIMMYQIV